jgi:hypothetical protein
VNSFWVDGAGVLEAMPPARKQVSLDFCLQNAAHDPQAYLKAWQSLSMSLEDLAAKAVANNQELRLTLCGERQAITYVAQKASWKQKFSSILSRKPAQNLREQL